MMNGKEKLYFLLDAIEDARTIAPSGQALIIDPANDLNQNYRDIELDQLFAKLEKDEKVLKVLKESKRVNSTLGELDPDPYDHADDGCWHIKLLPAFNLYYTKIQNEPEYQEWNPSRKPTSNPAKSSSNSLMTYEEKLNLIVKAIVEASKTIRKGVFTTTLYLNATNGLDRLPREEIHNILLQLQDENALKVHPLNNRLLPPTQQPTHYFLLDIPEFDSWYEKRLLANKSKLENLSKDNFQNVYNLLTTIENELQLNQSKTLTINFVSSFNEMEGYDKTDIDDLSDYYYRGLTYLKTIGVINSYTKDNNALFSDIVLNPDKFYEILQKAKNRDKQDTNKQIGDTTNTNNSGVIYEITYTPSREILLNKNFQLAKPDFDTENDLVFDYLYNHSNQKFTKEQLEGAIKRKLTKDLHKIVENLGFKADLRKMFFNVSGTSMLFRNPVTKKKLEELGIQKIKIS